MTTLSEMFLSGNILCMSILTLLLASLFLTAWKAPAWLRNVGHVAFVSGLMFGLLGLYQIYDYLQQADNIANAVLYGGYKCAIIPVVYGIVIYVVSLILDICLKPRI